MKITKNFHHDCNKQKVLLAATLAISLNVFPLIAEPIVLNGAMVPDLIGAKVASLRLVNCNGESIPFQIDEITAGGEYVCPQGEAPNAD